MYRTHTQTQYVFFYYSVKQTKHNTFMYLTIQLENVFRFPMERVSIVVIGTVIHLPRLLPNIVIIKVVIRICELNKGDKLYPLCKT